MGLTSLKGRIDTIIKEQITRPSKIERFLDKCERAAKKVVKAFAWIEKYTKMKW